MAAYYAQGVHFSGELFALHLGGCFFQQYIVDVIVKIEQNILKPNSTSCETLPKAGRYGQT
jgi:hypothetical protein